MPFQWREFLSVAREASGRDSEAWARTAVSRAYYAAFCAARERLEQRGIRVPATGDAHQVVWTQYSEADDGPQHYIGLDGRRLRAKRRRADYDAEPAVTRVDGDRAVRLADTILAALDRLP